MSYTVKNREKSKKWQRKMKNFDTGTSLWPLIIPPKPKGHSNLRAKQLFTLSNNENTSQQIAGFISIIFFFLQCSPKSQYVQKHLWQWNAEHDAEQMVLLLNMNANTKTYIAFRYIFHNFGFSPFIPGSTWLIPLVTIYWFICSVGYG